MGGSSSGKGGSFSSGIWDYMFNPIGTLVGKVAGIEIDPIGSMAASQATNISNMIRNEPVDRQWFGDSWFSDIGSPIIGQETRIESQAAENKAAQRQAELEKFQKLYGPSSTEGSLLTDEEE